MWYWFTLERFPQSAIAGAAAITGHSDVIRKDLTMKIDSINSNSMAQLHEGPQAARSANKRQQVKERPPLCPTPEKRSKPLAITKGATAF